MHKLWDYKTGVLEQISVSDLNMLFSNSSFSESCPSFDEKDLWGCLKKLNSAYVVPLQKEALCSSESGSHP